ncbi:MAG TPA: protein kinase [Bryobacteraceae bacterium]|nr:protein kinase [Bryobacteraceae bacterium]
MTPERFRQIEELYHAAREREPEKRDVFLALVCRGDGELRQEVESLLARDASSGKLLDRPAWEAVPSLLGQPGSSIDQSTQTILGPGTQLGPYRIEASIGAGGMGEVYRAVDTRLDRKVAIKVCARQFSGRFEREARAIAALNHPHVCHLYDVGPNYLVMELVEGETLATRLKKGALSLDQALQCGSQTADALAAAHSKGIVHRDLKPGNIMLTKSGVKVLDFGLAKSLRDETLTATDAVMGTPAYMAPEQREGKECDARSDIYALGLVLHEMATGKRSPRGQSPSMEGLPPQFAHVIERCLESESENRWQSASDVRRELEWVARGTEVPLQAKARAARLPWAIAAAAALAAIAVFLYFRQTPRAEPVMRSIIAAPENTTNLHSFAISPDGRHLAIAAVVNGKRQLWLRALDALQAQPVPGTEDATFPFWSPDSRYIGFFAQGKLKKIAASGGLVQPLAEAPAGFGGSWNREGTILFSATSASTIQRVSTSGGIPAGVTSQKSFSRFPVFLPDGRHFFYLLRGVSAEQDGVYLSSLDGDENRRILPDYSSVVFAAGRLLFIRENTLMAQPFDAASGQMTGEVFPFAEGVFPIGNATYAPVTASETGVLLYEGGGANRMAWYDRAGKLLGAVGAPGPVWDPAISPDAKVVAFRRTSGRGEDLWLRDLTRGAEQRLTSDVSINFAPSWSPRGDRIAFSSNRGGVIHLYERAATGTGRDQLLLAGTANQNLSQWSQDGRFIVYHEGDPKTNFDIWVLPMDSGAERKPVPFLRSEFNELFGQLSPDTHWMAYTSDETGQREVYVRPFPVGEGQWKISLAGGQEPRWRGDGKELFFAGSDGKMMAVAVKAVVGDKPSFEAGAPQPLFEARLAQSGRDVVFEYDVTADGKRFLLDTVGDGSASAPVLTVVSNWDAGLKK